MTSWLRLVVGTLGSRVLQFGQWLLQRVADRSVRVHVWVALEGVGPEETVLYEDTVGLTEAVMSRLPRGDARVN